MKTYQVERIEVVQQTYTYYAEVEAGTKEEAVKICRDLDFADWECVDSEITDTYSVEDTIIATKEDTSGKITKAFNPIHEM